MGKIILDLLNIIDHIQVAGCIVVGFIITPLPICPLQYQNICAKITYDLARSLYLPGLSFSSPPGNERMIFPMQFPLPPPPPAKRRRGAQPGKRNARVHGLSPRSTSLDYHSAKMHADERG